MYFGIPRVQTVCLGRRHRVAKRKRFIPTQESVRSCFQPDDMNTNYLIPGCDHQRRDSRLCRDSQALLRLQGPRNDAKKKRKECPRCGPGLVVPLEIYPPCGCTCEWFQPGDTHSTQPSDVCFPHFLASTKVFPGLLERFTGCVCLLCVRQDTAVCSALCLGGACLLWGVYNSYACMRSLCLHVTS